MEIRQNLTGEVSLGGADKEHESSTGGEAVGGDGEDPVEALDGPEDHDLGGAGRQILGPAREYIDAGQCKGPDHFAQKGDFFLPGLDQSHGDAGRPDLDGQAGEAGARSDVEEA